MCRMLVIASSVTLIRFRRPAALAVGDGSALGALATDRFMVIPHRPPSPDKAMPPNKVLLQGEDEDHSGHHRDGRGCHQQLPALALLPEEEVQAERDCHLGGVVHDDQRPQEAVPVADEGEDGQDSNSRGRDRNDDAAEDADVPAAIDLGGFLELPRDGEEELSEQEGPERGERPGQDQGLVRVDPAELCMTRNIGMTMTSWGTMSVLR